MRVIAARSKFFYQMLKRTAPPPRAYSRSWIRAALPLRLGMPLFISSFYGNGGTKFPQRFPGATSYEQSSLISKKILGVSMTSYFTSEYLTMSEYLTHLVVQTSTH